MLSSTPAYSERHHCLVLQVEVPALGTKMHCDFLLDWTIAKLEVKARMNLTLNNRPLKQVTHPTFL